MNHLFDNHYAGREGTILMIALLLCVAAGGLVWSLRKRQRFDVVEVICITLVPLFLVVGLLESLWIHWPN